MKTNYWTVKIIERTVFGTSNWFTEYHCNREDFIHYPMQGLHCPKCQQQLEHFFIMNIAKSLYNGHNCGAKLRLI
jgi:hypothetical protein